LKVAGRDRGRRGRGQRGRDDLVVGRENETARQAVDQAMADIEGQLKSSLAGNRSAGEPSR